MVSNCDCLEMDPLDRESPSTVIGSMNEGEIVRVLMLPMKSIVFALQVIRLLYSKTIQGMDQRLSLRKIDGTYSPQQ